MFAFLSFLLIAANLRPAITTVGPLISSIQDATGLSGTALGLLSSLPLLAFAAFAPLANFGRRFGLERVLTVAMVMLFTGLLIRSSGSAIALYCGTLLLAAGIAIGNVLVPSIIKRDYPDRINTLTTIYALVLTLTAAIASGLAVPLERLLPGGWQSALAVWAIPAALAAALWAWASFRPRHTPPPNPNSTTSSVWRSPIAWCVTTFMGLQSLCFYVSIAWLPKVIQDNGHDPAFAGLMITGLQLISLVSGAAMPRLLAKRKNQSGLALFAALTMATGFFGLLAYPKAAMIWVCVVGFGSGISFPLAIALIGLRTRDHHQATSLSLMSQSIGYLLAASGPLLFGLAHDISGGWLIPLGGLTACAVVQAGMGYLGGRDRFVTER